MRGRRSVNFFRIWGAVLVCLLTASFSSAEKPESRSVTIRADIANLLIKPQKNALVLDTLKQGDTVTLIGGEGDWYIVRLADNRVGWLHRSFLMAPETPPVPPPAAPPVAETKEEASALYQAVLKIKSGRVREAPFPEAPVKFSIEAGTLVSVIAEQDSWYHIRLEDGRTGWSRQRLFSRDLPRRIESIQVSSEPDGSEKVVFRLNGFYPPKTFAMEEDNIPKVVCDFFDTGLARGVRKKFRVDGALLQQIRTGIHDTPRAKIRVVMDLNPSKKYSVDQVFFKKNNIYTLTFRPLPDKPLSDTE
ncbi:hypothetical protein DENIS_0466 [Desulfonema ishimotonii]|uniref:SH3b domain-containing protein n=1 Tax=Desulfonema ishimotonii TaxID=45657 RepID=A0A401FRD7_9BACT|nr:SH3 domain-containing protein [Desulfonema ishimotonii]GBC59527.1 hypothetical protein DENIS_0466 [Desulfonema ishimotonii]